VLESRLAESLGVAQRGTAATIERVLERAGLPVSRPTSLDAEAILAATRTDKKSRGGVVEYALPVRIGAMANAGSSWSVKVDDGAVREVLA
jgi:3-dehydroquinate synthetase